VALTAHAMQEDLDRCLTAGMNDYITKPFVEEDLRQKLERWLSAAEAADAAAAAPAGQNPPVLGAGASPSLDVSNAAPARKGGPAC
jgi:CheY-like chemotaxis protein